MDRRMEKSSSLIDFDWYFMCMFLRRRVIAIQYNKDIVGWVSYMIGEWGDIDMFHHRRVFSLVPDSADGTVAYMDYLASDRWNKDIRKSITATIIKSHPSVRILVWYRPTDGEDRRVIWRNRCLPSAT